MRLRVAGRGVDKAIGLWSGGADRSTGQHGSETKSSLEDSSNAVGFLMVDGDGIFGGKMNLILTSPKIQCQEGRHFAWFHARPFEPSIKSHFWKTSSTFGDTCTQNGSKIASTAPRPHLVPPRRSRKDLLGGRLSEDKTVFSYVSKKMLTNDQSIVSITAARIQWFTPAEGSQGHPFLKAESEIAQLDRPQRVESAASAVGLARWVVVRCRS